MVAAGKQEDSNPSSDAVNTAKPTSWVAHPEDQARCPDGGGAVQNDETLACLLHEGNLSEAFRPFNRTHLFLPEKFRLTFSDVCGDADGASVVRCSTLDQTGILARSQKQASRKEGRAAKGAVLADVNVLRSVRHKNLGEVQLLFVYDDPTDNEPLHALIRGLDINRTLHSEVIDKVEQAFNQRI